MKKQLLWSFWLLMSILWWLSLSIYIIVFKLPSQLHQLGQEHPWFIVNLLASIVNILACVYIGSIMPSTNKNHYTPTKF